MRLIAPPLIALILTFGVLAADPAIVSHIKVLSDKVEDVSSIDAWKKSFIKDGMTDEQKALAVWETVVKFRHQDIPPNEFLTGDGGDVHDPIKTFNVYGYNMCCCESSNILALAQAAGLEGRGWGINGHSVPEVKYGGAWHLLDASLVCYFRKPDQSIAGVEDIISGIGAWYAEHPEFKRDNNKLYKFMGGGNWRKGPAILANTTAYDDNGWLPAATHGWYSTMQEYDGRGGGAGNTAFQYMYGYSMGYEVNLQLRPGEKLTRNWSNKGLHINQDSGGTPGSLIEKNGEGQLRYAAKMGDLGNGRIGNGTMEYKVPLDSAKLSDAALTYENLRAVSDTKETGLNIVDETKPAVLVLDMPSSYVYLDGNVQLDAVVSSGGNLKVSLSDNHGLDWKELANITESGAQKLDLKPHVFRRYDYRLKFEFKGKGRLLNGLTISHTIQHSQRALPALAQGDNKIQFSAGPSEGTVTLEAKGDLSAKGKQLTYADFHPKIEGLKDDNLLLTGGAGSVTFPVETPGPLTRVRFGSFYRARDAKDGWDYQLSFDAGKSWQTVTHAPGLTGNGACLYVTADKIPPDTHAALVRFAGTQRNTTMISNFRIDADYAQPHGGFAPVKITYKWEENGAPKEDVHVATKPDETYTIHCGSKPVMTSIALELAN